MYWDGRRGERDRQTIWVLSCMRCFMASGIQQLTTHLSRSSLIRSPLSLSPGIWVCPPFFGAICLGEHLSPIQWLWAVLVHFIPERLNASPHRRKSLPAESCTTAAERSALIIAKTEKQGGRIPPVQEQEYRTIHMQKWQCKKMPKRDSWLGIYLCGVHKEQVTASHGPSISHAHLRDNFHCFFHTKTQLA